MKEGVRRALELRLEQLGWSVNDEELEKTRQRLQADTERLARLEAEKAERESEAAEIREALGGAPIEADQAGAHDALRELQVGQKVHASKFPFKSDLQVLNIPIGPPPFEVREFTRSGYFWTRTR